MFVYERKENKKHKIHKQVTFFLLDAIYEHKNVAFFCFCLLVRRFYAFYVCKIFLSKKKTKSVFELETSQYTLLAPSELQSDTAIVLSSAFKGRSIICDKILGIYKIWNKSMIKNKNRRLQSSQLP